jgi:hypothetical protein
MTMYTPPLNRREMLCRSGLGFGSLALGDLLTQAGMLGSKAQAEDASGTASPLSAKQAPAPAKVKQVIHIFLNGGCSQVDTFDPQTGPRKVCRQADSDA